MPIRYLARFTNADESIEVVFPTHRYEYEQEQDLHNSFADLTGADYAYDMVGAGRAAKKNGIERVRFFVVGSGALSAISVDDQIEAIRENCHLIGRGRLWQVAASGGERWASGRLDSMATLRLTVENVNHMPVSLTFQRMSDWQEE